MEKKEQSIFEKYRKYPSELFYILLWILFVYLLFNQMPDVLLYAKNEFVIMLPYFVIMFILPLILSHVFNFLSLKTLGCFVPIGSIILLLPLFYLAKIRITQEDLEKNGVLIKGIVYKSWAESVGVRGRHRGSQFYIEAEFEVDNISYSTRPYNNSKDTLIKGDTVLIEYSLRNPKNNRIVVLEKEED